MQYSLLAFAVLCGAIVASDDLNGNATTTTDQGTTTSTNIQSTTTEQNTTTTEAPKTTTSATTTPAVSSPETTNNYTFYKNNTACLKAIFSAHFQKDKQVWNVSMDATIDNRTSSCDQLSVKFGGNDFSMVFSHGDKGAFYISGVHADLGAVKPSADNLTLAKTSNGSSYLCTSGFNVNLSENVTLYLKNVQLQAFHMKDGKFATAQKCQSDLSPLVPIIVGAVLAGLIIIVVVAYFIGRRRNRTGYEEI